MKKIGFLILIFLPLLHVNAQAPCVSFEQRQELLKIYIHTNGDNWNSSWDTTKPVENWYGVLIENCTVTCIDMDGLVCTSKNFYIGNNLTGELEDLKDLNLPDLNSLNLCGNNLSGSIPDFTNLPSLTRLDLSTNQLIGQVPLLTNLPNLVFLSLQWNQLEGTIPNYTHMNDLATLDLSGNQIVGSIPSFFRFDQTALQNLRRLVLSDNQLSGTVPDFSDRHPNFNLFLNYNYLNFGDLLINYSANAGLSSFNYGYQSFKLYGHQNILLADVGGLAQNNTYSWYKDNILVETNIVDNSFNPATSGNYRCLARNSILNLDINSETVYFEPTNISISTLKEPDCYDDETGSIIVSASGIPPLSYLWSNGSNSFLNSNLKGGPYTITVTDGNGFTTTASIQLTHPAELATTINTQVPFCNGSNDGLITSIPNGGTSPYTYQWEPFNIATSSQWGVTIASNLSRGNYPFTITDANGCTLTSEVQLDEPDELNISMVLESPTCYGGNDGKITYTREGGTPPFNYQMSPSATGVQLGNKSIYTNFGADNYLFTITDANGCIATSNTSLTDPPQLSIEVSTESTNCNGSNDGAATVTNILNGSSSFSYLWPNGNTGSSTTGLSAGIYSVSVTDSNGCFQTENFTIEEPSITDERLDPYFIDSDTFCVGAELGFVVRDNDNISALAEYQFYINSNLIQNGISPELYTTELQNGDIVSAIALDAAGCTHEIPNTLTINIFLKPEIQICNSANDIEVTLIQGNPPWSFELWNLNTDTLLETHNGIQNNSITLPKPISANYEIRQLGLDADNCVYTATFPTGSIEGCSAVCVGYNQNYNEIYTAYFPNNVNPLSIAWSILEDDSGIDIISPQGSITAKLDFSNHYPDLDTITLQATVPFPACGADTLRYYIKLDTACVWPGDPNNDGQVDTSAVFDWINDISALDDARRYVRSTSGSPSIPSSRSPGCIANSTFDWAPQSAEDWLLYYDEEWIKADFIVSDGEFFYDTLNLKYADCNGSGVIEYNTGWNSFSEPFSSYPNPSDYDYVTYFAELGLKHDGNMPLPSNQKNTTIANSLHFDTTTITVVNGNELVTKVRLGGEEDTLRGVNFIAFYFDGRFGMHKQPAIDLDSSHISNSNPANLIDYPFPVDSTGFYWYVAIAPPNDSTIVDFYGQEVCSAICHMTVDYLQLNLPNVKQSADSIPVTIHIPAAGVKLSNGQIVYVQSNIDTVWVLPNPHLNARVFLEGAFDTLSTYMTDNLRASALLPATAPYTQQGGYNFPHSDMQGLRMTDSTAVLSVTGQGAIVDWVMIEIRHKDNKDSLITSRPALLTKDGYLRDVDGVSTPQLWHIPFGEYYVLIRHRNHLPIMTSQPVLLDGDGLMVDFTASAGYGYGQKELKQSFWGLCSGDMNSDQDISGGDKVIWANQNGSFNVYKIGDLNLDANVNAMDKILWNNNIGKFSIVPK